MCSLLHTETAVGRILTRAVFRGDRGWEASGRGESSGAFCPTRKAALGGARQEQKGHGADIRLALRGMGGTRPPDGRRRRAHSAELLPPRSTHSRQLRQPRRWMERDGRLPPTQQRRY